MHGICGNSLVPELRSHWDPCGSDFPTCEPIVEGPCRFHENILQPCFIRGLTEECSLMHSKL